MRGRSAHHAVDVPVLFRFSCAATSDRVQFAFGFFFCARDHHGHLRTSTNGERDTFYCIDARPNFPPFSIYFCSLAVVCHLDMLIELVRERVSRFRYVHERTVTFESRRIHGTRVN